MKTTRIDSLPFDSFHGIIPDKLNEVQVAGLIARVEDFTDHHMDDYAYRQFEVSYSLREHYSKKPNAGYDAVVHLSSELVQATLYIDVYGHGTEYWFDTNGWGDPLHGTFDDYDPEFKDEVCE
jgi:hypothetical protein